jgi:hypothetical protein
MTATDKITFNNGDISSGVLLEVYPDHIVFNGQMTGRLTYEWKDVKSVVISSAFANQALLGKHFEPGLMAKIVQNNATAADNPARSAAILSSDGSGVQERSALANETHPASQPPANIVPHWGGQVSTQDNVTRATQDVYQLGGSAHLSYETTAQDAWKHQVVDFNSFASFGEASKSGSSPVRTALFEGSLLYNVYLANSELKANFPNAYNSYFMFALADGYHNLSLGINTQQSYGVGIGWTRDVRGKANKNGDQLTQVFGIQGDFRYSNQQLYPPGMAANLAGAGIKESYSIGIPALGPKLKPLSLSESITIIPYFNNSRAMQVRGTTQVSLPLTQHLSIGPKLMDDYFRNAPHTSKQNYLQPTLNITYTFGPLPTS